MIILILHYFSLLDPLKRFRVDLSETFLFIFFAAFRVLHRFKRSHVALSFLCVGEHVFLSLRLKTAGGGLGAQPPPFANLATHSS